MNNNKGMYDGKFLKEKYNFSADDYGSWTEYLKAKVKLIKRNGLEAVKMDYDGYVVYDIYSFNGDCKFDVVVLGINGYSRITVNHNKKEVSPFHGYPSAGKSIAKKLGYTYRDIY